MLKTKELAAEIVVQVSTHHSNFGTRTLSLNVNFHVNVFYCVNMPM